MPILGDLKNFKPTEFQIFFLSIIFKSKIKVKVFANVKNLFICKVSVFFIKWNLWRFSGIGIIKIYLIGSLGPVFESLQKVLYHSTLVVGGSEVAGFTISLHPSGWG